MRRRAKYLLLELERGHLLMHLGMSGSLRVLPVRTARESHDHFDVELDSGWLLRFNDPRRFGSLMHVDRRSRLSIRCCAAWRRNRSMPLRCRVPVPA